MIYGNKFYEYGIINESNIDAERSAIVNKTARTINLFIFSKNKSLNVDIITKISGAAYDLRNNKFLKAKNNEYIFYILTSGYKDMKTATSIIEDNKQLLIDKIAQNTGKKVIDLKPTKITSNSISSKGKTHIFKCLKVTYDL